MPKEKASIMSRRMFASAILCSFVLLVSACGEISDRPAASSGSIASESEFIAPVPKLLQKHAAGLTAEVEARHEGTGKIRTSQLSINDAHQVSGTLTELDIGNYTFTIRYRINGILVATETSQGLVGENETTPIIFASLTFPDEDNDGFTNLAEVIMGSDHANAASKPPVEIFRFSTNFAMTDIPGISPLAGSSLVGVSSSTNFEISPGGSFASSPNYIMTN